ncbi:MAG: RHS repeat protein, partial [Oscillospiraceae bacterium]|nr:RHS repeat protein [Oscillospiraceae bacterium]
LLDYAGRETVSLTPYKKIVREYYGDGNVKKESVYDNADNPKCVSDVLYFYNDLGLLDITLTGYKPGETYFISKTLYTYDGLPEYEITYLDAQKTDTSSPTVPEKANASVVKYEYDESGNVLSESSYIGEFALADLASVKFAKKSEKEYDVKNYTITEKSGKIKTVTKYNYLDKPVTVKDVVRSTDIISADKNEETELTTVNTYDKNGNLIKTVTPAGAVTEYRYDSLDRITETIQNGVPAEEGNGKTGTLSESISYNWAGSVTKKILKFGNQVKSESAYYYDSRNNMVLSVDKVGNNEAASAFEYNNAGLVIVEAAPESFDGVNSEETDPVKKYSVSNASSKIRYIYDAAGRLKLKKFEGVTYKFDKKSDGMTASDSSFVVKAYSYDANDNIIKEVEGEEYSKAEESGDISKAKGTTYTYSGTNNVITECYPECDKEYSALYDYDALGNVTMEKILKGTSGSEKYAVTTTSYSQGEDGITSYVQKTTEEGNEDVSSVSPMLSVKSWKTDVNGNIIEESIGKNTVKKEYNTLGLESRSVSEADRYEVNGEEKIVNSEVKTIYDKAGNPAVIINNSGITEINEYDILNRLVSKTTGKRSADIADNALTADKLTDSVTQKWSYDVQGNVRCEYDGNGFKTEYQYDELNRLVNTIQKYGSDKTAETRKSYDLDGNLTEEVSLIDGNQTGKESFVYDGLGRVVQKSDASGEYEFIEYNRNSDQEYSYDAQYAKKSFEYNSERQLIKTEFAGVVTEEQEYDYAGNVSKKNDGEGNAVLYYYDVLDRLVKVTSKGKDSEAEAETASYTYNDEGNIATKTAGSKNKVSYQYTGSGEIKETIANGKTDKFFYNSDGRLERSVDPAGNETVYTYTAQGLIAKEEVKSGGKVVITKSYTYDKNGNVLKSSVKENDKENVITRTYDELGRVTKKEATGSVTSEFVYDQFTEDKLLYEVNRYANGESTSNVYDESGRLKYVYSKDISKGTDESEYTEYTYDYKGRRTGITYPNGAKSEYVYYNNNNLKTLTNFVKDKEVEKYEYSYYKNNMMSEKKEIFDGVLQGTTS